jgi:MoaA/NifB/PqqE/SkfB family radical SAM enzyme
MTPAVFAKALERALEYSDVAAERFQQDVTVSLCGLGEPLLNRNAIAFTRQVRESRLRCALSTNASLLDENKARGLVDAGLKMIYINAGDRDDEYEDVYRLPFERTRDNVVRFLDIAGDQCQVLIVLVDHRDDPNHTEAMKEYWRGYGVRHFVEYDVINRGGALFVDYQQYASYPELTEARRRLEVDGATPACVIPFLYLFIGYDGQYYLCCSDWRKQAPMGSVFDESFVSITRQKIEHVRSREPVCKSCNHDPLNRLTGEMRAAASDPDADIDIDALVDSQLCDERGLRKVFATLDEAARDHAPSPRSTRRTIPVTVT